MVLAITQRNTLKNIFLPYMLSDLCYLFLLHPIYDPLNYPAKNMASAISSSHSGSLFGSLKKFDAYPKTMEDFRIKTYGGAASK